jgi:hypothetical protein
VHNDRTIVEHRITRELFERFGRIEEARGSDFGHCPTQMQIPKFQDLSADVFVSIVTDPPLLLCVVNPRLA